MNIPKAFEPVVTEWMRDLAHDAGFHPLWLTEIYAHPDFQRQLRAYAASVARQMVPGERDFDSAPAPFAAAEIMGHNACRAATLSAIDEWEKGE